MGKENKPDIGIDYGLMVSTVDRLKQVDRLKHIGSTEEAKRARIIKEGDPIAGREQYWRDMKFGWWFGRAEKEEYRKGYLAQVKEFDALKKGKKEPEQPSGIVKVVSRGIKPQEPERAGVSKGEVDAAIKQMRLETTLTEKVESETAGDIAKGKVYGPSPQAGGTGSGAATGKGYGSPKETGGTGAGYGPGKEVKVVSGTDYVKRPFKKGEDDTQKTSQGGKKDLESRLHPWVLVVVYTGETNESRIPCGSRSELIKRFGEINHPIIKDKYMLYLGKDGKYQRATSSDQLPEKVG